MSPIAGTRIRLVTHGPTAATALAAVPAGEPLDERGRAWAATANGRLGRADHVRRAPDRACGDTCDALGLDALVDDGLAEWRLGAWAGRRLDELSSTQPGDVVAWLSDPQAAPHGGESLTGLVDRVRAWLAARPDGTTIAVCGPAVVRAAIVVVLGAPPLGFWRVDVAPLTVTVLQAAPRGWSLRSTACSLRTG
jgi:broad specificity phosphatase PhoE